MRFFLSIVHSILRVDVFSFKRIRTMNVFISLSNWNLYNCLIELFRISRRIMHFCTNYVSRSCCVFWIVFNTIFTRNFQLSILLVSLGLFSKGKQEKNNQKFSFHCFRSRRLKNKRNIKWLSFSFSVRVDRMETINFFVCFKKGNI